MTGDVIIACSRRRTPARRARAQTSDTPQCSCRFSFCLAGQHWKVLVLLMVQTGWAWWFVEVSKNVQSTASVLDWAVGFVKLVHAT